MMHRMTFSATDRVARAIRARAKKEGRSFSQTINLLIEEALSPVESKKGNAEYMPSTFSLEFKPGIDQTKLNELAFDLLIYKEDEI